MEGVGKVIFLLKVGDIAPRKVLPSGESPDHKKGVKHKQAADEQGQYHGQNEQEGNCVVHFEGEDPLYDEDGYHEFC